MFLQRPRSMGADPLPRGLRRLLLASTILASACLAALIFLQISRHLMQMQEDPHVATVWMAGVTYGPEHKLTRGSWLLQWLNDRGIYALGRAETITSRYAGEPGGVEIWFAYRSHLPGQKPLECHRVGRTAFVDDLDQPYHGFLDFQGDYVGVYLPAYDHAAHRLTCTIHWMPRMPKIGPASRPMRFTIDLPPTHRVLPPARTLAADAVTQTLQGVTVTVGNAYLSPPNLGGYGVRQRDLIFHLGIKGGKLAASNADEFKVEMAAADTTSASSAAGMTDAIKRLQARRLIAPWNVRYRSQNPFVITDPYGISLIPPHDEITPMMSLDTLRCTRDGDSIVWIAPVNGAGKGTDAVHMRFEVQPASGGAPISFDLNIRVRTTDEI